MAHTITLLELCKALANNEFTFYYQPIISLVTGKITSAEALLRWMRPDGTTLMPASFLPLANEKGFITEITREMFPRMLDDLAAIHSQDEGLQVSFNVTAQDLETGDLAVWMKTCLDQKGIRPDRIFAEIVEDVLMPPNPRIRENITGLAGAQIPLVLNDFSAGNTSIQSLSQLPLSVLKLSMKVVKQGPNSRMDFRILRHLVSLAHQLRLDVVAEGVENKEIYDLVLSTGCTNAQGYYFSVPLPLPAFINLLKTEPRWLNYPFGLEYLAQIDHIDLRRDVIREAMILYKNQDEAIRQRVLARLPMLEPDQCLLAEWHQRVLETSNSPANLTHFSEIHRQFHDTAKAILAAASCNEPWSEIEGLIARFSEQSAEIMHILQGMATGRLLEHYQ